MPGHWKGIVGRGFTPEQFEHYVQGLQFRAWRPRFVVLHNTAVPTLARWHDLSGEKRMRGLEHYYRDQKGWSAGPHVFVEETRAWVFTPLTVPGVHSPSWNGISWGVEMVGDYSTEPFETGMGQHVRETTLKVLVTLHAVMGLDSASLRFHREDPVTTHRGCPGDKVVKAEIVAELHEQLAARYAGEHDRDRGLENGA